MQGLGVLDVGLCAFIVLFLVGSWVFGSEASQGLGILLAAVQ